MVSNRLAKKLIECDIFEVLSTMGVLHFFKGQNTQQPEAYGIEHINIFLLPVPDDKSKSMVNASTFNVS